MLLGDMGPFSRHPSPACRADELLQFGERGARDLPDAMAGERGFVQQPQACDILLGIEPAIVIRADGIDGAVAFFPDADGVNGETGLARHELDGPDGFHLR